MEYFGSIKEAWETFKELVIPKHVPPEYVELHRQTFYAAYQTAFSAMLGVAYDTNAPANFLRDVKQELEDFNKEMEDKARETKK